MSWRFRKTFKVIPGVRLNLSRAGLSATIGSSPLSFNVGPDGVKHATATLPGTGISYRHTVPHAGPARHDEPSPGSRDQAGAHHPKPQEMTEIRSASTERMTSESLLRLKAILADAHQQREELGAEIRRAEDVANLATSRYEKWERGILFKRLRKQAFDVRRQSAEVAVAHLEELREQLSLSVIAAEIDVSGEQAECYYRMRDDFSALSNSAAIWDMLAERSTNRVAERTVATRIVDRQRVGFALSSCDLIQWHQKVPYLQNRSGGDLYLYPGFILYRASRQAFSVIGCEDVTLSYTDVQFIESESLPRDATVVGHAWAKANKDGSPDRRFSGNHQMPIVSYGCLVFTSSKGLNEEFQFSNPSLTEAFARSWSAFEQSISPSSLNPGDRQKKLSQASDNDVKVEFDVNIDEVDGVWCASIDELGLRMSAATRDEAISKLKAAALEVALKRSRQSNQKAK